MFWHRCAPATENSNVELRKWEQRRRDAPIDRVVAVALRTVHMGTALWHECLTAVQFMVNVKAEKDSNVIVHA